MVVVSPLVTQSDAATVSYTYDSLNRLTKADYGAGVEISYTYDAAGNRLTYSDIDTTPYVDTKVTAWGSNSAGQTNVPVGLNNVVAVAAGYLHSLVLRADGAVVAWGYNGDGQTTVPVGLSNIVAVAAGDYHNLALRTDSTVVTWGNNSDGQTDVPAGLINVVAVAAGGSHSLALRANGTVVAWGNNSSGQTDVPAGLINVVAVAAGGSHSLALRADGSVVAWGGNSSGQTTVPAGLSNVVAVAAGAIHNLALKADGTVVAWGYNGDGQTTVPVGLSNIVAVAAGYFHSLALRADGSVVAWGDNYGGQTTAPAGLSNVLAMAGGRYHSVALSGNLAPILKSSLVAQTVAFGGTATFRVNVTVKQPVFYQWQMNGTNLPGATGNSLVLTNVTVANNYSVVASNSLGIVTSSALLNVVPLIITNPPQSQHVVISGTVSFSVGCESVLPLTYQWRFKGTNLPGATSSALVLTNVTLGQEGGYTVVVSNSAGSVLSDKAALTVDQLAVWGSNDYIEPTVVPTGLSNVVAVAGGWGYSLALKRDGAVIAWGYNGNGETTVPIGLSNAITVAADFNQSLALRSDGTVVAWGAHVYGPFGTWSPVTVPADLSNVVSVAPGSDHTLALRADSTVFAWGGNLVAQLNVPVGLSNVVAVAAGSYHSLALLAGGNVVAWGENSLGQTNVPVGLSNVVAVAAGWSHNLALRADGSVVGWGTNYNAGGGPPLTVPIGLSNVVAVAAGAEHSLALRADGEVIAWGNNWHGQTNVPTSELPFAAISAGPYHNLAIPALGPPHITSRLARRQVPVGGTVYFRVESSGAWPLHYQWRRNGVALPGHTNALLQLTGVSANDSGDYTVIVSNHLGVATIPSANLFINFLDVQMALDNILPWSGNTPPSGWFSQTATTYDGVDAAQSGAISHNQESWLESSVVGPGTLTYWWKVSSEPDYDYLEFYLDGSLQTNYISGEVPWNKQTHNITAGSHTLRWRYAKDISDSFGQDAAWLDKVSFSLPTTPPQFGGSLSVSNGVFNLQLTGTTDTSVIIESSFNLTTWLPLQTNTLPVGGLNLAIPVGTNQQQFFRARIP